MNLGARYWGFLFFLCSAPLALYLLFSLREGNSHLYMPGPVSYAHHQLESACGQCHGEAFSGSAAIERRCRDCHQEALSAMNDAHGIKKFSDPRNADWLSFIDARQCLVCHQEHVPGRTTAMALTQPRDFCVACHADVGKERSSHRDLEFASCAQAGCHNYHDATTLHENFLARQLAVSDRERPGQVEPRLFKPSKKLSPDISRPKSVSESSWQEILRDWGQSQHAYSKGNCSECHRNGLDGPVASKVCKDCHASQKLGWGKGRHGMREAAGLPEMAIAQSQLPMNLEHGNRVLQCNSCHPAHRYDTQTAQADACLACHKDEHSLAWRTSSHATAWRLNNAKGASCATCHMPREAGPGGEGVNVQHNQSANLRPNDKMLKTVCLKCHGIEMSMSALADSRQIRSNFMFPTATHTSLEWVRARQKKPGNNSKGTKP